MSATTSDLPLTVGLSQTSSSPPIIRITVINRSQAETYTILKWWSPLDPLALPLGLVSITVTAPSQSPDGEATEFPVSKIMLKRAMPPPEDDFVTLAPGEKGSQEVIFRDPVVDINKLVSVGREGISARGEAATVGVQVVCGGDRSGDDDEEDNDGAIVWRAKRKEDLTTEEIATLGRSPGGSGEGNENSAVRWKVKSDVFRMEIGV